MVRAAAGVEAPFRSLNFSLPPLPTIELDAPTRSSRRRRGRARQMRCMPLPCALSAELRTTQRITEKCPAEGRARQGCASGGSGASSRGELARSYRSCIIKTLGRGNGSAVSATLFLRVSSHLSHLDALSHAGGWRSVSVGAYPRKRIPPSSY